MIITKNTYQDGLLVFSEITELTVDEYKKVSAIEESYGKINNMNQLEFIINNVGTN